MGKEALVATPDIDIASGTDPERFNVDLYLAQLRKTPQEREGNFSLGEKVLNAQIALSVLKSLSDEGLLEDGENGRFWNTLIGQREAYMLEVFNDGKTGGGTSKNKKVIAAGKEVKQRRDQSYINAVGVLGTDAREAFVDEQFEAIRQGSEAYKRMAEGNLVLVAGIAKKYKGKGVKYLDLIGYGNVGLVRAIPRYNYLTGFRFSTRAVSFIREKILEGIKSENPVQLTESTWGKLGNLFKSQNEAERDDEEARSVVGDLDLGEAISALNVLSLDMEIGDGEDVFGDFVPSSVNVEKEVGRKEAQKEVMRILKEELTPEEEAVMVLRLGLIDDIERDYRQIGRLMKFSYQTASNREKSALGKLKSDRIRAKLDEIRFYNDTLNFPGLR